MARNVDVVSLKDVCLLTVGNYLSPSNVWSIYRLVPYVHCKRIEYIVHSFICDHFMDISHTDQFLALDEKEMQWLVDNHDIVASEAAVLDGLARWYKHSEHQRENALKQLFDRLHVSVIRKDVLWEVIKRYELHKVIPDLLKYKVSKLLPRRLDVDELIYQENVSNIAFISTMYALRRQISPRTKLDLSKCINCSMPSISKIQKIELKQLGQDLTSIDNYIIPCRESIYIFWSTTEHAEDDGPCEQFNACLDLRSRTLDHRSPPPCLLPFKALAVTCGTYVFLLGGRGYTELLSTVYRYDVVTDRWDEAAPMMYGHAHKHQLAVELVLPYNNRFLYVFGQHCEKYDMYTNTWTPIVPPWDRGVYCRSGHICNDQIYIFAVPREQPVFRFFMYDINSSTWHEPFTQIPLLITTTSFFGKSFALLQVSDLSRATTSLRFAEVKLGGGKFKVCNIKEFPARCIVYGEKTFHIMVGSRRMRMLIEQTE